MLSETAKKRVIEMSSLQMGSQDPKSEVKLIEKFTKVSWECIIIKIIIKNLTINLDLLYFE